MDIDSNGNIYVTGNTQSSDFPTTSNVYSNNFYDNGMGDIFLTKFNNDLTNILASTYVGGSNSDDCYSVKINSSDYVYIAGTTNSTDFPTTTEAYNTNLNGDYDAYIAKLDSDLTNLISSTYLGGNSGYDYCRSMAIGIDGNVYITGRTSSSDFPTTSNAYYTSYNNSDCIYLSKLSNDLSSLLASTYFGGSSSDDVHTIFISEDNNIYLAGWTESTDFPTTKDSYDIEYNGGGGSYDAYVAKFDANFTNLLASTYLGGNARNAIYSLAIDSDNNIFVSGLTYSSNFPTTTGAYDITSNGNSDTFVSKIDSDLKTLLASTYLGGSSGDVAYSMAIDSKGNVYVGGNTQSSNFPTTSEAYDTSGGNTPDNYISKFDNNLSAPTPTATTNSATNITINSATLNGTVNANGRSTTVWFEYGLYSGLYDYSTSTKTISGSSDQSISISISNLYAGTTYYFRIVAENEIGTTYGDEMSFTTLSDTTKPSGSISINNGNSYTNSSNVTVKLSASDDVGITWYYISTNSSTPSSSSSGWTSISSTTNYSASISYTLDDGDGSKAIYVWYKDDAGNISDTYSDSIILDTTPPEINITSPTTNDTYSTNISVVSLWGNASDATSGISTVKWENNKGGSGTASGTTSWSISNIGLLVDAENIITVTAKDNAGNSASDKITVTYSESTAEPTATPTPATGQSKAPTVVTGSATDITESSATLNGTVNPNGVTAYSWFEYSISSGTYSKSTSKKTISGSSNSTASTGISISNLSENTKYYFRIVAENSNGTSYGNEVSFTTEEVSMPTPETTQTHITPTPIQTPIIIPTNTLTPTPTAIQTVTAIPKATATLMPTPKPTPAELGAIFGNVVDTDGKPVANATVFTDKGGYSAKTGSNGIYQLNNVAEGSYLLTALAEGYGSVSQTVTVTAGETTQADFTLLRAITPPTPVPSLSPSVNPIPSTTPTPSTLTGKIFGYVMDEIDNPVKKAKVRCKGKNTNVKENTTTNKQGYFEFNNLSADSYKITAKKKGFNKSKYNVNLDEGEEKEIEIVLEEK